MYVCSYMKCIHGLDLAWTEIVRFEHQPYMHTDTHTQTHTQYNTQNMHNTHIHIGFEHQPMHTFTHTLT